MPREHSRKERLDTDPGFIRVCNCHFKEARESTNY